MVSSKALATGVDMPATTSRQLSILEMFLDIYGSLLHSLLSFGHLGL
jgi:hypothetical protein